jgi:hypothetical protein
MPHRIHGAGIYIYANIWGILMVNVAIYSSTMDPMPEDAQCFTSKDYQSSDRKPTIWAIPSLRRPSLGLGINQWDGC